MFKKLYNKYFKRTTKSPEDKVFEDLDKGIEAIRETFRSYKTEAGQIPEEPVKPKKFKYEIFIKLRDNTISSYNIITEEDYKNFHSVYKNFLKWYHFRDSSESYSFVYTNGCLIFNKKDILSIQLSKSEVTDEL